MDATPRAGPGKPRCRGLVTIELHRVCFALHARQPESPCDEVKSNAKTSIYEYIDPSTVSTSPATVAQYCLIPSPPTPSPPP